MVQPFHHFLLLFFILVLFSFPNDSQSLTTTYDYDERAILLSLKQHWENPSSLHHWNSTSSPCHLWPEISCIAGSVTEISLPGMNIQGSFPSKIICQLKNLTSINLYTNNLSGTIPLGLSTCSKLEMLDLSINYLTGKIPGELFSMKALRSLEYLDLSNNQLNGSIPEDIGNLFNLSYLDLSRNSFSGPIPATLLQLYKLHHLSVAYNHLSGEIPEKLNLLLSLTGIDLSHNRLYGTIPKGFRDLLRLRSVDVSHNQFSGDIWEFVSHIWITPTVSLKICSNKFYGRIPYELVKAKFIYRCFDKPNLCSDVMDEGFPTCPSHGCSDYYTIRGYERCLSNPKTSKKNIFLTCGAIAGVLIGLVILILLFKNKGRERRKEKEGEEEWNMISFQMLELLGSEEEIMGNLTDENLVGSGGSGKVYRVTTRQGERVAVKSIRHERKQQCHMLDKQFLAEVKILGEIRHCNIVKLLCCITRNNTKLLVYEYMDKQCLYKLLHGKKNVESSTTQVLDWEKRLKIAIGAARGLKYMHNDCSPPIVHRDIKSSNILLDSEFNAKIADFGLAKMPASRGDPETASAIVGTFGYIAPEYGSTRKVSVQSDVYSFGVVLLELTTGREAVSANEDMNLAQWAHKHQSEGNTVVDALDEEITDPRYIEAATTVFKLGLVCTLSSPSSRPSMKYVLQILQRRNNALERAIPNRETAIQMN